jgi:hypothetical protein
MTTDNLTIDVDDLPNTQTQLPEIIIISHSTLLYWWPLWALGYLMALITLITGTEVSVGSNKMFIYPVSDLGVIYCLLFVLVSLFTNVSVRGIYSLVVVLVLSFLTVLLALFGWWHHILSALPYFSVYMNTGFYLFFSTLLLIVWLLAVFGFDRLSFWRIHPGQMTFEQMIGGSQKSYDTRGLQFEKQNKDLFRHVILGLGAGDLKILTSGAHKEEFIVPNVLFVDKKVDQIQRLINIEPDSLVGFVKKA